MLSNLTRLTLAFVIVLVLSSCTNSTTRISPQPLSKTSISLARIEPLIDYDLKPTSIGQVRVISDSYNGPRLVPELEVKSRDLSGSFDTSPSYEPRLLRNATITNVTKVKLDANKSWAAAYFLLQSDTSGGKPVSVKVNFTATAPVTIVPFDYYKRAWQWGSAVTSAVSPIEINLYSDYIFPDGYCIILAYLPTGECLLEKNSVTTATTKNPFLGQPVMYGLTTTKIGTPTIDDVCAIPGGGAMIAYKFDTGTSIGKRIEWGIGPSPSTWSWFSINLDSVPNIQQIRTSIIGGRLAFFMTDNQTVDKPRGSYSISDDSAGSNWSKVESIAINGIYCSDLVDYIDNIPNIMTYGANGGLNQYLRDASATWKQLSTPFVVGEPNPARRISLTVGSKEPNELLVGFPDANENNKYGVSYLGDTGWISGLSYPLTTPIQTPSDGYTNIAKLTEINGLPAMIAPGIDPKNDNKLALYYTRAIDAKGLNWTTSRRIPNTREIELDRTSSGQRYRLPHAWTLVDYNGLPIAVWVDEIQTSDSFRIMRFRCAAALDQSGLQWAGPRAFGETYIKPGDRVEIFAIPVADGIVVFHEWVDDLNNNTFDIAFTHIPIS